MTKLKKKHFAHLYLKKKNIFLCKKKIGFLNKPWWAGKKLKIQGFSQPCDRQQQANSIENFCKPRGPQHTYYYIVENARTRNEVHWRITVTPKRGVTSRDRSF